MTFFYANRVDKSGNQLLTSYGNLKSAEKYGGAEADISEGEWRAEFSNSLQSLRIAPNVDGPVVRSYMKNNSQPTEGGGDGRYVLWGKIGGVWAQTGFTFSNYGAGNTLMKSLIGAYQALLIVDTGKETPARSASKPLNLEDL